MNGWAEYQLGRRLQDGLRSGGVPGVPAPIIETVPDIVEIDFLDLSHEDDWDIGYEGGVEAPVECDFDSEDEDYAVQDSDFTDSELSEFDEEMLEGIATKLAALRDESGSRSTTGSLKMGMSTAEWKKAEAVRKLGYLGNSERTRFRKAKEAREREEQRQAAKVLKDPQVVMMRTFFAPSQKAPAPAFGLSKTLDSTPPEETTITSTSFEPADLVDYASDHWEDFASDLESEDDEREDRTQSPVVPPAPSNPKRLPVAPPRKRRKLAVSVLAQRNIRKLGNYASALVICR
ncbi:unnamed protein product [Mycena citricolor]|uniref:Uncharacterized protein n=1 Tax=Mycena citricolor TaxID=2018698 RepID=A0AAD2I179_9AGAR|nr:unnamed protein product [Mycena citricolor]